MNNKSEYNLIHTVSDVPFGYINPSPEDDPSAGWDLSPNELDPNFVTGFTDAEGCFTIIIEILGPSKWKVRSRGPAGLFIY
jgi:hypothetical protein